MITRRLAAMLLAVSAAAWSWTASAGPIFLTGHDPDFHAQDSAHAKNLLHAGLNFVTNGMYDDAAPAKKFLWVESRPTVVPSGHRRGELGLNAISLTLGTHYDRANAAELATVDLSDYSAIVIASSFGGLLSKAELDELIDRKTDITAFINAGGGLMAMAECLGTTACDPSLLAGAAPGDLYGYLPVTVSSIPPTAPFTVTAAGAAAPFNLVDGDVNDPTHNSFGLIGGLTPLDLDSGNPQQATTLAGNVQITEEGFTPVPEPATVALFGIALVGLALARRRPKAERA